MKTYGFRMWMVVRGNWEGHRAWHWHTVGTQADVAVESLSEMLDLVATGMGYAAPNTHTPPQPQHLALQYKGCHMRF